MIDVAGFKKKLDKVDGKIYVIEEEIQMPEGGVYEDFLEHDNINEVTLTVYTGSRLTGERIRTYALSTPSMMPWKRMIRIQADVPTVYICYETDGDTVEAEDVNLLQDEVVKTQKEMNAEEERAMRAEESLRGQISSEGSRAQEAERALGKALLEEAQRAGDAERKLRDDIESSKATYVHPDSGVMAGTYHKVTVDTQGHVTEGSNAGFTWDELKGGI